MLPVLYDEKTHTYTLDGVVLPSVTQVLKTCGIINTDWFNEEAALRGTHVHQVCQFYDEKDLDEDGLDPQFVPYLQAWKAFLQEIGKGKVMNFHLIETPMAHKLHQFAGTVDRVLSVDDKLYVIDIKTGAIALWTGLQLAGYQILIHQQYETAQKFIRLAVQLKPDGKFTTKTFNDKNDLTTFLCCASVARWKIATSRKDVEDNGTD